MTSVSLLGQILDHANRADPYPLYAELRRTPVVRDEFGPYLVSTYWEIHSLLHDPRVSSDVRHLAPEARTTVSTDDPDLPPSFIRLDPPDHDRLRRLIMRTYGPLHAPGASTTCAARSPQSSPTSSTASRGGTGSTWSRTSPTPSRSP